MLDSSPEAVYSALQRAHKTIDERLPRQSQQATMRELGDDAVREIVERFVDAWERSDVDAVTAMLTDDATMDMPPLPNWYQGREPIAVFLRGWPLLAEGRFRVVPTRSNGQLAFVEYMWDGGAGEFRPHGVMVVTLEGDRIAELTAFLGPDLPERFGMPATYPGPPRTSK